MEWASERTNERSGAREQSEQCEASEWVTTEQCERMSGWRSEWPSTQRVDFTVILPTGYSEVDLMASAMIEASAPFERVFPIVVRRRRFPAVSPWRSWTLSSSCDPPGLWPASLPPGKRCICSWGRKGEERRRKKEGKGRKKKGKRGRCIKPAESPSEEELWFWDCVSRQKNDNASTYSFHPSTTTSISTASGALPPAFGFYPFSAKCKHIPKMFPPLSFEWFTDNRM